ncbi:alpha carbonic anhydrase 7-like [Triticum dicoccoides]|uniref:alpha carbonic anhydrase 7-like n=1 Tax=Triticum dicoccoides TaxID=85692 RepID=UPI0018906FF0|nr:alpha carbonic anhydrase 7-like [Triticum dicoccoides]
MRPSRDLHLAMLLLFSASVLLSAVPAARAQQETDEEEEFSYSLDAENGPAHWGDIKEEWSACGKGNMQSPIDLASPRVSLVRGLGYLNHSYAPANATIVNRGHDIMLKFEGDAGSVSIGGTPYFLRQLHWHSPTEHSVNGRRYDMELHMFHESTEGKAAVIGIFYEIGAHDAFLHKLEPYLEMIADRKDREEKMGMMDPRGARGKASVYYRYLGSLTTPPCSEGVIWTIVKRVRTVSRHQLELLREAVHDDMEKNARPRQEVNSRDISMFRPFQQIRH